MRSHRATSKEHLQRRVGLRLNSSFEKEALFLSQRERHRDLAPVDSASQTLDVLQPGKAPNEETGKPESRRYGGNFGNRARNDPQRAGPGAPVVVTGRNPERAESIRREDPALKVELVDASSVAALESFYRRLLDGGT